jgi:phosphoglycolate phosphatase
MPNRAIIFDLDGTLLDTLEDIATAFNRVLLTHGFPAHPVAAYCTFVGDGVGTLVARALPKEAQRRELTQQCIKEYRHFYATNPNEKTRPYPGIRETLDILKKNAIPIAVLSNKPQSEVERCVKTYLSGYYFHQIRGQNPHVPLKPDPASALHIAQQLAITPQEMIFTGDTGTDMKTASAAGMVPAGVLWGFRSKEELIENGAKILLQRPQDILPYLNLS